ncbi:MAG: efflux RND transporter periplasmic adaptor subunit [Thermodesulfobacteriota bacterium]
MSSLEQNPSNRPEDHFCQIDPALWTRFAHSSSQEEYCRAWLALQCSLISNASQGILALGDPDGRSFTPVSRWPEEGPDPERLAEVSERVIEERCGLLLELDGPSGSSPSPPARYGVAYPVLMDDRLHGVVAVEVLAESADQLRSVMEHLQWGVSWLEILFRRSEVREGRASKARLRSAVDILAAVLSVEASNAACMTFVTDLATHLGCDRVTLAFMHKNHARVQAMSHSAQFGERMNLVRAIEMAMDEAFIQRKEILYPLPAGSEPVIVRDHEELSKQHGAGCILTIPFYGTDRYYGVLTLERPAGRPFVDEDVAFCRSVGSLLFPALEMKRQNDRPLLLKAGDAAKKQAIRLLGPRYPGRKLIVILVAAVAVFFSLAKGDYRVTAHTVLEGAVKRVVAAPFDGYVREAEVRAGDVVEDGTRMCALDDRDLRLERLNWLSKRTQYQRQHQEALAQHDRAKAEILKAQLDQAAAQFELVESKLARTQIRAPFRGIIITGDLSQKLGGAVSKGEALFEVAPLDAYRVILEVDERRIADVQPGQKGSMILSALPSDHFDFEVEKITPVSAAKEGMNFFRVEAKLEVASPRLRPGMEGVGKVYVDQRKLISIWTRDLREWVRVQIWSWWP